MNYVYELNMDNKKKFVINEKYYFSNYLKIS